VTSIPVELPSPDEDGYPRVDGSTSTAPLEGMIIFTMMEVPCEWATFVDGNRYLMPDLTGYRGDFPGFGHHGTHSVYLNLINGEADLILVARSPSMEEIELAQLSGVELDIRPVALDAFVFIANENNPVDGLSLDEIQRIYTGELTNWDQVGGPQGEIHPYQRDEQSGSQQLMLTLVMKGLPMVDAPILILLKMIAPFYAISEDLQGIGYSVFYYEENMAPKEKIKLLAVDGIKPDHELIQTHQYPFTTEVYMVVRADSPLKSIAMHLRDWLLSPTSQEIVEQSGYVPIQG
jgi:phosphate transport system substrate-binding protein